MAAPCTTPSASGDASGDAGGASSGESSASSGAGGLHSVIIECDICSLPELECSGAQFPETQSTFRSDLTVYSCDYAPEDGFDGLEFHVDCQDGPDTVRCKVGYCGKTIVSDGGIHFENADGSDAFVCRAPRSVR